MPTDAVAEALHASQQDQVRVVLYLAGGQVAGVVARVDGEAVELREGAERIVVRLSRIDAVRRS
jgi:hypothetical protein